MTSRGKIISKARYFLLFLYDRYCFLKTALNPLQQVLGGSGSHSLQSSFPSINSREVNSTLSALLSFFVGDGLKPNVFILRFGAFFRDWCLKSAFFDSILPCFILLIFPLLGRQFEHLLTSDLS